MEPNKLHEIVSVTTIAREEPYTTVFLSLKGFLLIKIRVSHENFIDDNGDEDILWSSEVEVWNNETKKWEILLGKDAFEEEEVEEALRDKDLAWLVANRGSEVFEYMEGFGEFFDRLSEAEMNEYIDSKICYYMFGLKEDK